MGAHVLPVSIEGIDIWGDARDAAPVDAPSTSPAHARATWERFRRQGRAAGMSRKESVAYATREVEKLHPPAPGLPPLPPVVATESPVPDPPAATDQAPPTASTSSTGGVQGLGDLPPSWPALPANASLAAEVSWVQANRLRVKQGEAVDLSRALSPAPSHASLGWLETSLLYPSKFADVAVKASAEHQDAAEDIRRERIALVDMQALLAEACSSATS